MELPLDIAQNFGIVGILLAGMFWMMRTLVTKMIDGLKDSSDLQTQAINVLTSATNENTQVLTRIHERQDIIVELTRRNGGAHRGTG